MMCSTGMNTRRTVTLLRLELAAFIIGFIATAALADTSGRRYDFAFWHRWTQAERDQWPEIKEALDDYYFKGIPIPEKPLKEKFEVLPPKFYGKWKDLNQSEAAAQRRWLKMNRTPTERLQDEIEDLEEDLEGRINEIEDLEYRIEQLENK